MNLDNVEYRLDILNDLHDYADSITDKMADDSDTNAIDWCKMWRFKEQLFTINRLIVADYYFNYTLYEMNDMKKSDEDSKWTFPFEKASHSFFKETFLPAIDLLIDCSRSWSFDDYRARNFQNELYQKMTMLKGWYTKEYDSEDYDE